MRRKINLYKTILFGLSMVGLIGFVACGDDDDDDIIDFPDPTGTEKVYTLEERGGSGVSGVATFVENEDNSVTVALNLNGTSGELPHPAHIHANSAAEGGDIVISLAPVDPATGISETLITTTDIGDDITYEQLLDFDGYINVHLSETDLSVVAQGDIGQNELTGNSKAYTLNERAIEGISGQVVFEERMSGEGLATIMLENTPADGLHPAHIHLNTAAEGGGIAFSFNPVDGNTGMSRTHVAALDDGSPFVYSDVLGFDGYVNVHLSADDLATIVAQGDIGQNELTGTTKIYNLQEKDVDGISGSVTFAERVNGEALATIALENTPADGEHPAHIHMNTAAEGGGIAFSFNPVIGATGTSVTNVAALDDGTAFGYEDVLAYDGYVNVHLSADDLATIVAQGDIGQNELSGETIVYTLSEKDVPGINGTATFAERINGEALATIMLDGTPADGTHPAHIHMNTAAEGGGIAFTFSPVDGNTGMSLTNVAELDDGTAFGFADVQSYDGYINVHLSADDLATIVAQGDIGQNELTGEMIEYDLGESAVAGISGTATFAERVNGEALATIMLNGTPDGGEHPAHIHVNTAVEGGGIAFTFTPVDGTTGMSVSNVAALDDGSAFGYADILTFDGYINVHLSADDLATIVAQGDIGQNDLTGTSITYPLSEVAVAGINGEVNFQERVNGEALATISLVNTPAGGEHPAHIHMNSAAEGGGIAYTFTPVNGDTGISMSNVATLDDGTAFGYDDVLVYDGYVNVHLSADDLGTIVAQGDIGSNVN